VNDPDCAFCRIVTGAAEASVVADRDGCLAFLDQRPVFPGHVLVIPREHIETLPDLPPEVRDRVFALAQRIAEALPRALDAHGTFVAVNNVVSQSVPHMHVHVVPRRRKDGLRGFFWPRTKYSDEAEQEAVRARIAETVRGQDAARGSTGGFLAR
jgi:histidine triad (HIT) family protein